MSRSLPIESRHCGRCGGRARLAAALGVALGLLGAWRAEGALGTITALAVDGNRLAIACGADQLEVQICASNVLRLDYKPGGSGDARTAIIGTTNWSYAGATIDTNADPIVVTTPAMRVEIARSPCRVAVADAEGTPVVWEPAAEGMFSDGIRLAHGAGADFYGISGYNAWDDSTAGLLRSSGGWAEAGYQGDCGAPLIWNRNGFGLLVDSDGIQFNATATNLVAEYCSRTEVEAYLLVGGPEAILAAAAEISGLPPMFPKWGMGFANTEWGITQSELTNVVAGYRSREIPLDLYILDFDWKDWGGDHYGEWVWNTTKFPGGPSGALQTQMDAQGVRIGGIMKPRVHVYTEQGGYATSNGFWWPGQSEYDDYFSGEPVKDVNFALADCREWYFDHITNAYDTGMVAWWNDEADQAGGGGMEFDNWQFLNMQKSLYEGQRGHTDRRVWSINRNFWPGAQRYAYAMWSGDIDGGFTSMANQRERMLSAIGVGAARWGMDIGGFNNADQTTSECYARWMQFGAVVPIFRVHGQQDQQRQPWVYGAQAEAVATAAIRLRYRLIPYVYSYDRRLHETGVGIVRTLAIAFPDDPATANVKDAWMFGDALLAAPVVAAGQTQKSVYLPAGTWRDFFQGTEYAGGQTIAYAVNSSTWEDLPLFARDGAIIPLQPVQLRRRDARHQPRPADAAVHERDVVHVLRRRRRNLRLRNRCLLPADDRAGGRRRNDPGGLLRPRRRLRAGPGVFLRLRALRDEQRREPERDGTGPGRRRSRFAGVADVRLGPCHQPVRLCGPGQDPRRFRPDAGPEQQPGGDAAVFARRGKLFRIGAGGNLLRDARRGNPLHAGWHRSR